jgi:DNA-directed RNA polymerase subunit M/transcription elongation factor TFIIS
MEFSQNCGTHLKSAHNSLHILACPRYGHKKAEKEGNPSSIVTEQTFIEFIIVMFRGEVARAKVDCPKCDGNRAYYWTICTSDDEKTMIEVQVFRCTRCGHSWREKG